mmetsp:Transcript_1654/g.3898  ORF Transcript_1654/g.3898 Transcript_1654/m.3898 type:complete len:258 (+) Transcript_1654:34-807(+)
MRATWPAAWVAAWHVPLGMAPRARSVVQPGMGWARGTEQSVRGAREIWRWISPVLAGGFVLGVLASPVAAAAETPCEGCWPEARLCDGLGVSPALESRTDENGACPQWRINAWECDRDIFLARLARIEELAKRAERELGGRFMADALDPSEIRVDLPWVTVVRYRGISPSRIERNAFVGSAEFVGSLGERTVVRWPDGYRSHYLDKHNVAPSQSFREYVEAFDVESFEAAVDKAMASLSSGTCGADGGPPCNSQTGP